MSDGNKPPTVNSEIKPGADSPPTVDLDLVFPLQVLLHCWQDNIQGAQTVVFFVVVVVVIDFFVLLPFSSYFFSPFLSPFFLSPNYFFSILFSLLLISTHWLFDMCCSVEPKQKCSFSLRKFSILF